MNDKLVAVGGVIVVVVVLVVLCAASVDYDRVRPPNPVDVVPDIARMASNFSQAKADCEARARYMQKKRLRFRQRDSRKLYTEAQVAHNGAIAFVSAVLLAPKGKYTADEIHAELKKADAKRQAFTGEFKQECAAAADGWGDAVNDGPTSLCEPLIGMLTNILALTDNANREAAQQLQAQIKSYEMLDWTSL